MTGKEQANLLGLLFWVYTGIQVFIVVALFVVYVAVFGVVFAGMPQTGPDQPPMALIALILVVALLITFGSLLLFMVPKLIAGYGLRNEKPWARTWAIVACCMAVMNMPLGTALGVWGLIFLMGDEGRRYFESPEYGRLADRFERRQLVPEPNSWR